MTPRRNAHSSATRMANHPCGLPTANRARFDSASSLPASSQSHSQTHQRQKRTCWCVVRWCWFYQPPACSSAMPRVQAVWGSTDQCQLLVLNPVWFPVGINTKFGLLHTLVADHHRTHRPRATTSNQQSASSEWAGRCAVGQFGGERHSLLLLVSPRRVVLSGSAAGRLRIVRDTAAA